MKHVLEILAPGLALAAVLVLSGASQAATKQSARSNFLHGAIAVERKSDAFGYSVQRKTTHDAQVEALNQCGRPGCEVVLKIEGDCGAVARPAATGGTAAFRRFTSARGATRAEAETKALRFCGKGCEIAVWACNR